jgi:hypothetical protein
VRQSCGEPSAVSREFKFLPVRAVRLRPGKDGTREPARC